MRLSDLKKIIREEYRAALQNKKSNKQPLNEVASDYQKIINQLKGLRQNINSFAVLTAEFPGADPNISPEANSHRTRILGNMLRTKGYGFRKLIGKYGNIENSFLVPNATFYDAVMMGKIMDQESILYGKRLPNGQMEFYLVDCSRSGVNPSDPLDDSRMVISHGSQATREVEFQGGDEGDYWSQTLKGKPGKFRMPFF